MHNPCTLHDNYQTIFCFKKWNLLKEIKVTPKIQKTNKSVHLRALKILKHSNWDRSRNKQPDLFGRREVELVKEGVWIIVCTQNEQGAFERVDEFGGEGKRKIVKEVWRGKCENNKLLGGFQRPCLGISKTSSSVEQNNQPHSVNNY